MESSSTKGLSACARRSRRLSAHWCPSSVLVSQEDEKSCNSKPDVIGEGNVAKRSRSWTKIMSERVHDKDLSEITHSLTLAQSHFLVTNHQCEYSFGRPPHSAKRVLFAFITATGVADLWAPRFGSVAALIRRASLPLFHPSVLYFTAVLCPDMPIYFPVSRASSDDRTLKGADLRRAQVPFLTCWPLPGMTANFWTFVIVGSVLKSEQVPFWFVFGLLLCFCSGEHVAHLYANTNTRLC